MSNPDSLRAICTSTNCPEDLTLQLIITSNYGNSLEYRNSVLQRAPHVLQREIQMGQMSLCSQHFSLMRRFQSASVTDPEIYCLDQQNNSDKNNTVHFENILKFKKCFHHQHLTRFSDQSCDRNKIHSLLYTYHMQFMMTPLKIPAFIEFEDPCKKQ